MKHKSTQKKRRKTHTKLIGKRRNGLKQIQEQLKAKIKHKGVKEYYKEKWLRK